MITIEKIFGWILLFLGVAIICWGLCSSFNIFTGRTKAPEVFKIEKEVKIPLTSQDKSKSPEEQMKEMMSEQLKEMLPTGFLSQFANLISWSIFVSVLIFGGVQISNIGVKLLKK